MSSGDLVDGGAGNDTVRSPLSQAELVALGATFTSIEVFEPMVPNMLGHGACYEDFHNKIRCECCEPGWGGTRCRECIDPAVCGGNGATGPYAKPLRTKYYDNPIPEFMGGVYPESVPYRQIYDLGAPVVVGGPGTGWWFDNTAAATTTAIPAALTEGDWVNNGEGRVWTLGLQGTGSQSIALELNGISLPTGSELWVYSEHALHGPVTAAELDGSDHTFVPGLPGDTVYIEIFEPTGATVGLDAIDGGLIAHGPSMGTNPDPPDSCFEDVACHPEADTQSQGVGIIWRGLEYWCSGSLLNTPLGTPPTFLTAHHCLGEDFAAYQTYLNGSPSAGTEPDETWMYDLDLQFVQFRFRKSECGGPSSSLDPVAETLTYPVRDLLYYDHEVDIGVLELGFDNGEPPDPTCVTYNGYDARSSPPPPPYTVGIRHPKGRKQQIDIDWDPPGTSPYVSSMTEAEQYPNIQSNHTQSALGPFWLREIDHPVDVGWIDGGSSGGPLFDHHGRVIGMSSGHSEDLGELWLCDNVLPFYDGRLGIGYQLSAAGSADLVAILGTTLVRDAHQSSFSDPMPLSVNSDTLSPCIGDATYVVNPTVGDAVHIAWEYFAAPGQVLGIVTGAIAENTDHVYHFSMTTQDVNPGGPEPPITVRITTDFGPGHPDCATTVREFIVEPKECI